MSDIGQAGLPRRGPLLEVLSLRDYRRWLVVAQLAHLPLAMRLQRICGLLLLAVARRRGKCSGPCADRGWRYEVWSGTHPRCWTISDSWRPRARREFLDADAVCIVRRSVARG